MRTLHSNDQTYLVRTNFVIAKTVNRLWVVDSEVVTSLWLYLRDRWKEVKYSWWSGRRAGACLLI